MTHASHPLPEHSPILLGRINHKHKAKDGAAPSHELLEEGLIVLLRQHCPPYFKMNGYQVRCALNRAFVRFLLERTRGNQARAAEAAGFNRNTLRTLIKTFRIDWKRYVTK